MMDMWGTSGAGEIAMIKLLAPHVALPGVYRATARTEGARGLCRTRPGLAGERAHSRLRRPDEVHLESDLRSGELAKGKKSAGAASFA